MQLIKSFKLLLMFSIMGSIALAQWGNPPGAVTEGNDVSQIDYSTRKVSATGIGAVPANAANVGMARASAIRSAKLDALRNLVEAVQGVRLSSETTIRNNMVEDDVIRTKVEAMVRGARQVGEPKYLSDSSVEIVMEVAMSGIMEALLPTAANVATTGAVNITAPAPAAAPAVVAAVPGQPITGLIIDARGLGIKPSMSPQVFNADGTVLYGPGAYPREFAVAQGVVGYHKDPAAAANDPRVAGNPVTLKGVGTAGSLATDVVISATDAQMVASFAGFSESISSCRVMIILD